MRITNKRKCGCEYISERDQAVRKGYELGGYLHKACPAHNKGIDMKVTNLELEIAKAINGPWDLNNQFMKTESRYNLAEVRSAKWLIIGSAEQAGLIFGVRSMIKLLHEKSELMRQFEEAVKNYE